MSASDHVSKYQFYRGDVSFGQTDYDEYEVHKGEYLVGEMGVRRYRNVPNPEHEVSALYVDEEHRHVVGTLLGLAHNRAQEAGTKLIPSIALSPYSSRVVKGLQERGLVTGDRENVPSNDADFGSSRPQWRPHGSEYPRLNTETVNAGRQAIRQKLKERKGR